MSQSLACGGSEQIPGIDIRLSRKYHTTNKVSIISAFCVYFTRVFKTVSWMYKEFYSVQKVEAQENEVTCSRSQGW